MATRTRWRLMLVFLTAGTVCFTAAGHAADELGRLVWKQNAGVVWSTAASEVALDRTDQSACASVRIVPDLEYPLPEPKVHRLSDTSLELSYRIVLPGDAALDIVRKIEVKAYCGGTAVVEDWSLTPSRPIPADSRARRQSLPRFHRLRASEKLVRSLT